MAALPLTYVARNLWVRRVTTALTAAGMALVVFVFATVLMMTEGIRATLVATGQPDKHEAFQPLPEGFRHVAWGDLEEFCRLGNTPLAFTRPPGAGESICSRCGPGWLMA